MRFVTTTSLTRSAGEPTIGIRAVRSAGVLLVTAMLVAAGPALAQQNGAVAGDAMQAGPGMAPAGGTTQLVATIEGIDAATRTISLRGAKGVQTLSVSSEVRNLPRLKVGDRVAVLYTQALARQLTKDGAGIRPDIDPRTVAGTTGRERAVVADVVAVNYMRQTVTLRAPAGTLTLVVPDAAQVRAVTTGDQVRAIYTEALAVAVRAATRGSDGD